MMNAGGIPYLSLAGESRRSRRATDAARSAAPRRTAPHRTARGEDGAKTEISIFRPLRGGSFDARICPVPRPVRAKRLSKHRRRARATPRSCTQPRPHRYYRCCPGLPSREIARLEQTESGVNPRIITGAPMFSGKSQQRRRRCLVGGREK